MRSTSDRQTAELDGLPPYAPAPGQKLAMATQGYQGPKERTRCETCRFCAVTFLNPDSLSEREVRRCGVGDFPVKRGGLCTRFEAAG
jgi:hypothetical protein